MTTKMGYRFATSVGGTLQEKTIAIFGGGYDATVEDQLPASGTRSMGRAIYILDAETGDILKSFGTADGLAYSIPGAATASEAEPRMPIS